MSPRLPKLARSVLEEGTLCYLAVRTANGPHLTPVVYALDGGHLWLTTSRRSVKARAWRRDPSVAGLVMAGDTAVAFRGRVRTYDAFDPLSWAPAAMAGPRVMAAAARFTMKNARFFAGYAVDARRVPLAWTPPGRVFARIDPSEGRILSPGHGPVGGWGEWPEGQRYRSAYQPLPPDDPPPGDVPAEVREAVGASGWGALAVDAGQATSVLPATWSRAPEGAAFHAVLPTAVLALAGAPASFPAALTVDRASDWRAADMKGMLLQGNGEAFALRRTRRGRRALAEVLGDDGADLALVRIRPRRVTWWEGWRSGTVRLSDARAAVSPGRGQRHRKKKSLEETLP